MLVQGKILSYGDDLTEVFEIRRTVFVYEQGISEEVEFDDIDNEAMHVIVYEVGPLRKAVATGRIYFDGVTCQIGRVAVLMDYRNQKYGDFTVRMLLNKAFTSGIKEVTLETQLQTEGFFETIGFRKVGQSFRKSSIAYENMVISIQDVITSCKKADKIADSSI